MKKTAKGLRTHNLQPFSLGVIYVNQWQHNRVNVLFWGGR